MMITARLESGLIELELEAGRVRRLFADLAKVLLAAWVVCSVPAQGLADDDDDRPGNEARYCSETAEAIHRGCRTDTQHEYWIAVAKCINISDAQERARCFEEARSSQREGDQLCRQQLAGRRKACEALGEKRYDPAVDPAHFDDPKSPTKPNRYYPLTPGHTWEYRGGNEVNTLEVLNETKSIEGVTCIVVRDQVFKDGDLAENTDDWFAAAKDGNVWYFGEEVKDFESFDGDSPRRPELVSIGGSFKAGRDRDKPGIIFQASPKAGQVYLEEFSLGNAEDVTEILSTTYGFGKNPDLDTAVPRPLAELLCSGNCVVTKNYSLLEPGIFARKYYAPGIGVFLEVASGGNRAVRLVHCNFDARCSLLPAP
jgi:hypothetical protein